MPDYLGAIWKVNYGEISDLTQFRVGRIGATSYDAYFATSQLSDLISVLTAVQGMGVGQLAVGAQLQARKVQSGALPSVRIETRPSGLQLMALGASEVADLIFALGLLQAALTAASPALYPDDWALSYVAPGVFFDPVGGVINPQARAFLDALIGRSVGSLNPGSYGAKGDGVTDDTSALQKVLNDAASSSMGVDFRGKTYLVSNTLSVPGNSLLTNGTLKAGSAGKVLLSLTGDNVVLRSLKLQGVNPVATATAGEYAVSVIGASAAAPRRNVVIRDVEISLFGMYGVYLQYVNGFSITNNHLHDLGYAGVGTLSASNGEINNNSIHDILAGFSANGYGIAITRSSSDSLTTDPRSSDIIVLGNRVANIPWEGIDTHGGRNLVVANNEVFQCLVGIAMVGAVSSGGINIGPQNVIVMSNVIDSKVSDGSISHGISIAGGAGADNSSSADAATGRVVGNVIIGCGLSASATSGAIRLRDTSGFIVTDNLIIEPSPHGVVLSNTNFGVTVSDNTIIDHWSDAVSIASAVYVQSTYNDGIISGNLHRNAGKRAASTYKNERGLNIGTAVNNLFQAIGNVFTACTIPYNGTSGVARNIASLPTMYQGVAATPGLTFGSDAASGFYPIGTSDFGLSLAGVLKLRFLATALTVTDGYNFAFGGTTGTKFGLGATNKMGFWGATPVVQPAAVVDATDAATTMAQLNTLLARLRAAGIIAP